MMSTPVRASTLQARLDALKHARGLASTAPDSRTALADLPCGIARSLSPSLAARLARLRPWTNGHRAALVTESDVAERVGGVQIAPGLVLVERAFPLPHRHGRMSLSEAPRHFPIARADGDAPPQDESPLLLDTETNGLAGGTGTVAFTIGVARFTERSIRVTQWLMTSFAGELAMLASLRDVLAAHGTLVTYNGAAFDGPLLRTRFRMHALGDPIDRLRHVDLLHWARRARAPHWPDARLQTLEREGLGFARIDDLPGADVPQAWRRWLRAGDASPLARVLEHNRTDLLTLAAVLALAALHPAQSIPRRDARQNGLFVTPSPWPDARVPREAPFVRAPWRRAREPFAVHASRMAHAR
jgi:hypothetical protein